MHSAMIAATVESSIAVYAIIHKEVFAVIREDKGKKVSMPPVTAYSSVRYVKNHSKENM